MTSPFLLNGPTSIKHANGVSARATSNNCQTHSLVCESTRENDSAASQDPSVFICVHLWFLSKR
jgi:hypothetical protein